jgi:hypothetical protein
MTSDRLIEYYTAGTRWGNYTGLLLLGSLPTFHGQPLPTSQKHTKQTLNTKYLKTGLSVISILLGCGMESLGDWCPLFGKNMVISPSRVKISIQTHNGYGMQSEV